MEEFAIRAQPVESRAPEDFVRVLDVAGPLTHATAAQLRDHLRRVIGARAPCPRLLLDLSRCTDIDVHGLLAVAVARRAARSRGGDVQFVHVPEHIARRLHQLDFQHLLAEETSNVDPGPRQGPS